MRSTRVARNLNLSRLGTRQGQQLTDQPGELVEFFELAGQVAALLLERARVSQRQLRLASEHGERRAQLVGESGTELTHLADRLLLPGQQVIEGE